MAATSTAPAIAGVRRRETAPFRADLFDNFLIREA
jgi:hypothetical protein